MADSKKYVSEFEIKSNIDDALGKLQKYYIEFSKMPSAVESFTKALKKSTDMEDKFYGMMSAIPKTMKRLSELSKIELLPRKELEKIANAVQLVSSAAKNLEGKTLIDVDEIKGVVGEFENIVVEMGQLESKHDKIITKSDKYNKLLVSASKVQKELNENSDKYSTSTKSVFNSYVGVKSQVSKISNELRNAKDEGKITDEFLSVYNEKLKGVKDKIVGIEKKVSDVNQLFSTVDSILENSKNVADDMQNAIAKMSYEKSIDQVKELKKELQEALKVKKSEEEIKGVRDRLEEVVESLNVAVNANERLLAETKTTNEAFNLMTRMTGEIYEEIQDISNIELKKQFDEARKVIEVMTKDLEKSIMIDKASNAVVREKMGLLKNEGDKLRIIVNNQLEIKKLEMESVSATVRRAKEQDKVNSAYVKQILSQRKNLGGLVDALKVARANIPNKAMALFGETGVVAGKAIMTVFKGLSAVFAPLMGIMGALAAIKTLFEMERQVKNSRKQMFMMAMDTNTVSSAMTDLSRGGILANSEIENMSKSLDSMQLISLGINFEAAIAATKEFQKQGFKATTIVENLTDASGGMFATAASLGMEIGELATRAGSLRTEFGYSLNETGKAFEQLRGDAKTAGITVSIFFDKVMNASVGLALWGQKIDLVSDVFANLVKNMKLPEAVSTKLAENMVKGFSGMSSEMQITTYMLGKGKTQWNKYSEAQNKATDERLSSINTELETAKGEHRASLLKEKDSLLREKRTIAEYSSMKGLSGQLARMRKMDVGSQIMTQLQAAGGQLGINFSGDIEALDTKFSRSFFEMEKLGETFGIDRDTMMGYKQIVSTLATNVKGFKDSASKMGIDDIKGLIGALADPQKTVAKVQNQIKNLTKKGNKADISSFAKQLAGQDEFVEYQKELLAAAESSDPATALAPILMKIDTGLTLSAKQSKDAFDKANVASAKRAGAAMLSQTKSTEDAINNTIVKILRDGFRFLEKLVNMFAFINRDQLEQFNGMNDRLDENRKTAEMQLDSLRGQESTLNSEISRLENEPDSKDEGQKKAKQEQLSSLKEQKLKIQSSKEAYSILVDKLSNAAEVLGQEGVLNKKVEQAVTEADTQAKITNKYAKEESIGQEKFRSTDYGKAVLKPTAQNKNDYVTSKFGTTGLINKKTTSENDETIQMGASSIFNNFRFSSDMYKPDPYAQSAPVKRAQGGVVAPGLSFKGDKILAALDSGELIVPEKTWQQYTTPGKNALESLIDSMKIDKSESGAVSTQSKTINDNRVINISVNQRERQQIEQIVMNALYTDKK
jgi:hypothetical protein